MKRLLPALIFCCLSATLLYAQDKITTSPAAPFDRFTIYETLIFLWIGIVGLIVIIRMKLREIERIQKMGIDREEKETPFLD